jgi:hypothetical protein
VDYDSSRNTATVYEKGAPKAFYVSVESVEKVGSAPATMPVVWVAREQPEGGEVLQEAEKLPGVGLQAAAAFEAATKRSSTEGN